LSIETSLAKFNVNVLVLLAESNLKILTPGQEWVF